MNFSTQKNGYDKNEVDTFIDKMKRENEKRLKDDEKKISSLALSLDAYRQKKDTISSALMIAVEKAKQIEDSSKNVYRLKIQELNILYKQWEKLLDEMLKKYPLLVETEGIRSMVSSFQDEVRSALFDGVEDKDDQSAGSDPIRVLLQKMTAYKTENNAEKQSVKIKRVKDKEEFEKPISLRPIVDLSLEQNEGFETLADKFLASDSEIDSAFAKSLSKKPSVDPFEIPKPNESGFSLEEAVNPTEALEEIMSAFDFYNSDDEK